MVNNLIAEMSRIGKDLEILGRDLQSIAEKSSKSILRIISDDLTSVLLKSEKSIINLRSIHMRVAAKRGYPSALPYDKEISVEIREEEHWVKISMPAVVHGLGRRDAPKYLVKPLKDALTDYVREDGTLPFRHCDIVVEHVYDDTLGAPRYIDYDNIEVKGIVDTITANLLTDDSCRLTSLHQYARTSDRDRTDLYVMLPEKFPHWLKENGRPFSV